MNFSWEMQINTYYPQIKHQQQTKVPFHPSPTRDYVKEHEGEDPTAATSLESSIPEWPASLIVASMEYSLVFTSIP